MLVHKESAVQADDLMTNAKVHGNKAFKVLVRCNGMVFVFGLVVLFVMLGLRDGEILTEYADVFVRYLTVTAFAAFAGMFYASGIKLWQGMEAITLKMNGYETHQDLKNWEKWIYGGFMYYVVAGCTLASAGMLVVSITHPMIFSVFNIDYPL
jgi:hypothetical protein